MKVRKMFLGLMAALLLTTAPAPTLAASGNQLIVSTVESITPRKKDHTDALLKVQTTKILSKITNSKMTRAQKLKACWKYMVDGRKFRYGGVDPDMKEEGWQRKAALSMFQTKRGNCIHFACAFAALAEEIGYKNIKLKMSKTHCWVTINNKHYDPQKQYTGKITGVYALKKYPKNYRKIKTYDYMG